MGIKRIQHISRLSLIVIIAFLISYTKEVQLLNDDRTNTISKSSDFNTCLKPDRPSGSLLGCFGHQALRKLQDLEEREEFSLADGVSLKRDDAGPRDISNFLDKDPNDLRSLVEGASNLMSRRAMQWDMSYLQPGLTMRIGPTLTANSILEFVIDPRIKDRESHLDHEPSTGFKQYKAISARAICGHFPKLLEPFSIEKLRMNYNTNWFALFSSPVFGALKENIPNLKLNNGTDLPRQRVSKEARLFAKNLLVPFLLGFKFQLSTLLPILFGLMVIVSKKALILSKIAVVAASVFGLQSLSGGGSYGGHHNYGSYGSGQGLSAYGNRYQPDTFYKHSEQQNPEDSVDPYYSQSAGYAGQPTNPEELRDRLEKLFVAKRSQDRNTQGIRNFAWNT